MTNTLSLAGKWRVCFDGTRCGDAPPSVQEFASEIELPATTETAGLGQLNPDHCTDRLTVVRRIEGPVWYQREFEVPSEWTNRPVLLLIERTKSCRVFVDEHLVGDDPILCAPHQVQLGRLTPRSHRLTLCVDNSRKPAPGENHQTSEHTQGNWNGLLGRLELRALPPVWIEHVAVAPDLANRAFQLRIQLGGGDTAGGTRLSVEAESYNHADAPHRPAAVCLALANSNGSHELTLSLGDEAQLWNEFSPSLYRLTITLDSVHGQDVRLLTTGLREFRPHGTQFTVNGRSTFLRGEVNCCVFPLTGHPPMAVDGWRRYLRTLQDYGLNHIRFHSWTPPDAAFTAADELGIYVQTELPFWGEWNERIRAALQPEGEAILRAFGHHPSFVLFSLGNEHRGDRAARTRLVADLRRIDPHRLYCEGANNDLETPSLAPADDCWITARVPDPANAGRFANVRGGFATNDFANGHLQIGHGGTRADYSGALAGLSMPVVSHEIGQFTILPNFTEIERYTGVFAGHNLEHFKNKAAAAGLLAQSNEAFRASGKLAALLYREEIEAALRTPGFGGFQLLGLQDFPGQGTALVGLLDAFMESKRTITPYEFRQFCGPQVLLARFDRHTWNAGELFHADLDLAHYGPGDLLAGSIDWQLSPSHETENETPLASGRLIAPAAIQGGVRRLGSLRFTLPATATAKRVDLILRYSPGQMGGPASPQTAAGSTPIQTKYPLWIYPVSTSLAAGTPATVKIVRSFDAAAQSALTAGGCMVLFPDASHPLTQSPGGSFTTDFWCWPMFHNTPGTMGLLIQASHPALAGFPTESYSNWQWLHLARAAQPVILDVLPAEFHPIVQVLDNLDRTHRLGLIFEARVGTGRLLVCAADLPALAEKHPEARQLLASVLAYVASEKFAPILTLELTPFARVLETKNPHNAPPEG